MDVLLGLVLAVALLVWGVPRLARAIWQGVPQPSAARSVVPRPNAALTRRRANAQARVFQITLLQLAQAPDFRRAASAVAAATLVPVAFRRRQFSRFRPQLVAHYRRCLAAGTDREVLAQSLGELVVALGVAAHEADYIRTAAEGAARPAPRVASPANQIGILQRDHEARVAAIRQGVGTDAELREQLLEAENQRHREALLTVVDDRSGGGAPVT